MKRLFVVLVLLVAAGVTMVPATAQSNSWTAEYFSNPSLFGPPTLIRTEASPTNDWGYGAPAVNMPADNFSARWTSVQTLAAGNYQISVRADDGVRVYVNGVLYIDEWHPATGQLYQATLTLPAGTHTFVVAFYEAFEVAFLTYTFAQVGGPQPGLAQATVTANQLNVRDRPDPYNGRILTRISYGQVYPVIGRNVDTSWIQINVNGVIGWVNRFYTTTTDLSAVPITDGGIPPTPVPPTNATATVTASFLNVRSSPNPFLDNRLLVISRGQVYPVIGRNADTSWLQINVNGQVGWVRSTYVTGQNINTVPITDSGTNPSPPTQPAPTATATVTAYFLNVRTGPGAFYPRITVIARGQSYPVIGRNANSSWVRLNVNGVPGWVNRGWVAVNTLSGVPVTG